jgi:hypothetical protein
MDWQHILEQHGLMLNGHFIGGVVDAPHKGLHYNTFLNQEGLAAQPALAEEIGRDFAIRTLSSGAECVVAVGPEAYGIGYFAAFKLGMPFCYLSHEYRLRDNFKEIVRNKRIVLVQSSIRGGGHIVRPQEALSALDASLVLALAVWDNTEGTLQDMDVDVQCLMQVHTSAWTLEGCFEHGLCHLGAPINRRPGFGAELEAMFHAKRLVMPAGPPLSFIS